MAIKFSLQTRNSIATSIVNQIDSGGSAAILRIYDGTQPTSPDTAVTSQNILSEHTLSYPCGTVSNGTITFNTVADDASANATGTATWARISTSGGNGVLDGSVSVSGGTGNFQMNTTNIVVNGPVHFTSLSLTIGG